MKNYEMEKEGQIDFFKQYQIDYKNNEVLINNTDGVWNSNIFEFKLNISNISATLFQAVKYLSKLRVKGRSIPKNILLISINDRTCYYFNSNEYFKEIHTLYYGASSKNNSNFSLKSNKFIKIDYSKQAGAIQIQRLLKEKVYLPINLDENCIVGWAERYYRENSGAKKGDFLGDNNGVFSKNGEIRNPTHFKGLINPYLKDSNEKFKYLMDKLNDRIAQKDLGAFYTPKAYCDKAVELVRKAIERVPEGNDYVIIDRCAGTGNLEASLTDKELEHCILSTYEYYEYKVLIERLGDKVKFIIPPTEELAEYSNGYIKNANALSEDFVYNEEIRTIIEDEKITIILLENPPYHDTSAITFNENGDKTKRAQSVRKDFYILEEFKKDSHKLNEKRGAHREAANLFIWSGFKYYLRQPTDSYVLLSPVKYFKQIGLAQKEFGGGFAFNRKYFHASPSLISCNLWYNIDCFNSTQWELQAFDIEEKIVDNETSQKLLDINKKIIIKRCTGKVSHYNDKRKFEDDIETNVICGSDGVPRSDYKYKSGRKPVYNKNIIAYIATIGFSVDPIHNNLIRVNYKTGLEQSFGYHLREDNYLKKLPVWCAKLFPETYWFEKDIYSTCSDGGFKYEDDIELEKSCLIFTALSQYNKIRSFDGIDGREYRNKLCFEENTLARKQLKKYTLDEEDKEIINLWDLVLEEAKKTKNYNTNYKYGLFQIIQELNTSFKDKNKKTIYEYKELNSYIESLKLKLKIYYRNKIQSKLFKYELLK
jgi:hypothetical protein